MSPYEHPSLYKPILHAQDVLLVDIMAIDAAGSLMIAPEQCGDIDVVIVCHAHNETGIINDVEKIVQQVAPDVVVMSDISQAFSRLSPLGGRIDVMTFSAQKMGGFAGAGGLMLRGKGKKLPPPWQGGGQERGFRPGTESALLLAAFGAAAAQVEASRREATTKLRMLRDRLEQMLSQSAPIKIIGAQTDRLPNTSAICFSKKTQTPCALLAI